MNLITQAEIVSIAFAEKNFLPGKILDTHIVTAQEGFIRPAIGGEFYDILVSTTPTGANAVLVDDYIKPALAWYVRYVILPELMVRATNTGVQLVGSQGATEASDKQAGVLREQAKSNADILMNLAIRYLRNNSSSFPYFDSGETKDNYSRVIGGVVFSRRRERKQGTDTGITPLLATGILRYVTDVRRIAVYQAGDIVICSENNYMYEYSETSEMEDNGGTVLKPNNNADAGRWLMIKELQMVNL